MVNPTGRLRGVRTRPVAALFAVLTCVAGGAACSPQLPEGTFECGGTGSCPTGWRCLLDDRCYSPGFSGFELYASCEADDDCASGLCVFPFDTSSVGQCSATCTDSGSCPVRPDPTGAGGSIAGVCSPNMGCLGACEDAEDCGADQRCVVVPMTPGETACIDFPDNSFSGRQTCMGPIDCPLGLFCVRAAALDERGVCSWPCSPGGTCPTGASCEPLPGTISGGGMNPAHACIAACNNTPGSCGPNLVCARFPADDQHCVPPGWAL